MSGITLTVPADRGATWTNTVVEQLDLSLRRLSRALAAPLPTLTVAEERGAVVLAAGDVRLAQSPGIPPATNGRLLGDQVSLIAWPGIVAPALAARGVGETWWLRHAALRGLTVDDLAALAAGGADDETIAWRLADRHPPLVTLRTGTETRPLLEDQELRAFAARDAAYWSGLPVPMCMTPRSCRTRRALRLARCHGLPSGGTPMAGGGRRWPMRCAVPPRPWSTPRWRSR